ncbi:MAG: hypothetical protein ACREJB_02685 [Planctomycetaceae bacterium]
MLTEPVVTAAVLEERLNGSAGGVRRIRIGSKAVVTPSARELLKHKNIRCLRDVAAAKSSNPVNPTAAWTAVAVASTPAVGSVLKRSDGLTESVTAESDSEAVAAAIRAIGRSGTAGVVVFTTRPAAVACRANRDETVRAAAVYSLRQLQSVREQLGPNMLCINPQSHSLIELRNLLRAIASVTALAPPDWTK